MGRTRVTHVPQVELAVSDKALLAHAVVCACAAPDPRRYLLVARAREARVLSALVGKARRAARKTAAHAKKKKKAHWSAADPEPAETRQRCFLERYTKKKKEKEKKEDRRRAAYCVIAVSGA